MRSIFIFFKGMKFDFKGVVHPKMKILSSFTLFQTGMNFFLILNNTREDILENMFNQTVDGSHWLS